MGDGNKLYGADERKTPSFSISADKLADFDEWVEKSDRFDSRAEALRTLMTQATGGQPIDDLTPREPPHDDMLAAAYRKLCRAGYPNGYIKQETALRVCSNGPKNLSKKEVPYLVLRPLENRGYVKQESDPIFGTTSWYIHGWEER